MVEYHRVRPSVPEQNTGFAPVILEAANRHRDGLSCRTPAAYTYDANGRGRWCIDCNAPLGEEASWHPDGADLSHSIVGVFLTLAATLVLCLVLLAALGTSNDDPGPAGPVVTPTTYGPPTWHGEVGR